MMQNSSSPESCSEWCETVLEAREPPEDVVTVISRAAGDEAGAGSLNADCGGSMSSIAAAMLAGKKNTSVGPRPPPVSSTKREMLAVS